MRIDPVLPTTSFFFLLLLAAGCTSSNPDSISAPEPNSSVVAMIGQQALTIPDFENRYARSVGGREVAAEDSLQEYEDFLERYIDFRLKVLYAEELGFDKDSSLALEINTYRKQLARPYLMEKEVIDPILLDLYEKQQELIDASHILLSASPNASPEDTLKAYERLTAIIDSFKTGADFGELAYRNSQDPSARGTRRGAKGRLGFFNAGQMVKPFEDAAYATPTDSISNIFRTQFGFHVLYVHARKSNVPDVWISHIATRSVPSAQGDTTTAEQRIQAIYERLQDGEDFTQLAKTLSEDQNTRQRGGELGRIAFTQPGIPESFRDVVFSLEDPGDYSQIIETPYGHHIVRLDKREPILTFEERYDDLKTQASRLPRMRNAEEQMAKTILDDVGFVIDTTLVVSLLDGKTFNSPEIETISADSMNLTIASLGDSSFTFSQVLDFAKTNSTPYNPDTLQMVLTTVDNFIGNAALDYEAARLEYKDDEFAQIMEEFRDGLLLFKLMEDSVWTAAAQDTANLIAHHSPKADSFWFPDRHRIISFRSRSDSLLTTLMGEMGTSGLSALINRVKSDTTITLRIDTTYIAGPNNSAFDKAIKLNRVNLLNQSLTQVAIW